MSDYMAQGNADEDYRVVCAIVKPERLDGGSSIYIRPEFKRTGELVTNFKQIVNPDLPSLTTRGELFSQDPLVKQICVSSNTILRGRLFMSEEFAAEATNRGNDLINSRLAIDAGVAGFNQEWEQLDSDRERLRLQNLLKEPETQGSIFEQKQNSQLDLREERLKQKASAACRDMAGLSYSTNAFPTLCQTYYAAVEEKEESLVEDIMNTMVSQAASTGLTDNDRKVLEHWATMHKAKAKARRAKAQADLTKIVNEIVVEHDRFHNEIDDTTLQEYEQHVEEAEQDKVSLQVEADFATNLYKKSFEDRYGTSIESPNSPAGWSRLWSSLYQLGGDPVLPGSEERSASIVRRQSIERENTIWIQPSSYS